MVLRKMIACVECGKRLGFFEGHYHPTLGKKSLVCSPCFVKVDESVSRWMEFVLSNSFNLEKKSSQPIRKSTSCEVALQRLNCNNNNTLIQSGRRTI